MSLMFVFIHQKVLQSKGGRCSALGGKENRGEKNLKFNLLVVYCTLPMVAVHERIQIKDHTLKK